TPTPPPSASLPRSPAPARPHKLDRYPPLTPQAATERSSTAPHPRSPLQQTTPSASRAHAHPQSRATPLVLPTPPLPPPADCASPAVAAPAAARRLHTSGQMP